ncbi:PTS cellobiose transporter subunit IIC [Enterobacter sp. BNK-29]|uniref:PTS cellobiose transporter subunit IIC n=1 Tax=Enterobacter sp. BNK-29 TaxID=3376164 RepID=UPI003B5074A1
MNNVLGFLESKLMPLAAKTAQQRHLGAIRGAYVSFMPFIIVGSILLVISSFPNQAYQQFMSQAFGESWSAIIEIPFNAVFSTMSLFISFLVAFRLAEHYGEDRISCGILALVAFLILTPFIKVAENGGITVIPVEWIGSKGLFVAMIGSLLWTELFCWLKRKKLVIKMPDGVPPAVQESFAALIPALLVMILVLGIRIVFENTHYNTIHQFIYEVVATPVRHYGTSYFGALMTVFSITILWSVGINSGSMINGIIRPLWMENQTDNIAAIQAGTTPPHIITEQFFDMIWMGGAGATLSLVIAMLIFARSKNMREVARLGAGASVFNINEPILFGLPVIMNPIMLIPFNLVPLVLVTVQYAAMKIGAVAVTTGVFIPWTLPPVISGFIVTGHLSGSVMQLINLLIGAMLYLPFMRILDKQYRAAEMATVTQTDTTLAKQE